MEETRKIYRQENKIKKSLSAYIGSILLLISAILPCIDRILVWIFPSLDTIRDARGVIISTNIWIASVYLAPVFIITAYFLKPNPKLFFFPLSIFFYSSIVYYAPIYGWDIKFLAVNSWLALFVSLLSGYLYMWLLKYIKLLKLEEKANNDFQKDILEEIKKLEIENKKLKIQLQSQITHDKKC